MQLTTLQQRATASLELWRSVMPANATPPDLREFIVWAHRFTDAQIEKAILRTAVKSDSMTTTHIAATFVTGTLNQIAKRRLENLAKRPAPVVPATKGTTC